MIKDRLGQLSDKESVYVYCASCGNRAELDVRKWLIQYGARMTFDGVKRRLRCQRCGERKIEWRFSHSGGAAGTPLVELISWKDRPE
jgi:hypothetical protein